MGQNTVHEARVILWKDGKVLACQRRESKQLAAAETQCWEFPGCPIEEDETALQAAQRAVRDVVGRNPSSAWPLDTVDYDQPDSRLRMECLVAFLSPSAQHAITEQRAIHWASRDELLDIQWNPADELVARLVGQHWDVLFANEHL